ncbi:Protein CHLOROPLAST IMPORT APPARATUS 2 [Linum perenne]
MASPCLSGGGGGRAYGFDLEIAVKSVSYSSSSSSPSSTLSESSNSPVAISTRRKPRTPRKRPNQTYNEAAALLSTAYPKIFSTKHFPAAAAVTIPIHHSFPFDSSDLLLPAAAASSGVLPVRERAKESNQNNKSSPAAEVSSRDNSRRNSEFCGGGGGGGYEEEGDDFDAESILDEEIEEGGIDSIMGNLSVVSSSSNSEELVNSVNQSQPTTSFVYGYPPGFNTRSFHRGSIRAFRRVDDWWSYPVVDVFQISPRLDSNYRPIVAAADGGGGATGKKKSNTKKKKKVEKSAEEGIGLLDLKGKGGKLLLKLNYDEVLKAWSGKDSPLPPENSKQGSSAAAGKQ